MIRPFVSALILILSAYAAAAEEDSALAASSPTPNPSSIEKITFSEVNVDGPYIAMTLSGFYRAEEQATEANRNDTLG
jgi:hypothetical protein